MAKGKKKKKDLDFQKVKLKVGKKLKRDSNETKAEFNSRKIVLKEVRSYSNDPITALSRHSDHISQHGKLSMLNHFNSALTPDIVSHLSKPIIDSLSKFLIDRSDQVRAASIKCLKTCYNHLKLQRLPTKDFLTSLKPYLDCAYTHVCKEVVRDCQKFLEHLVNINDPLIFEPLMMIILRRHEAGDLNVQVKNLSVKLRRYYLRHQQKQSVEEILKSDRIEPLHWTPTNFLIDLDYTIHNLDSQINLQDREFTLGYVAKKEDTIQRYLDSIPDTEENLPEVNSDKQINGQVQGRFVR